MSKNKTLKCTKLDFSANIIWNLLLQMKLALQSGLAKRAINWNQLNSNLTNQEPGKALEIHMNLHIMKDSFEPSLPASVNNQ
jgi:hypothetical protein